MRKLKFVFTAIGDYVSMTAIPENYFEQTGEKLIVDDPNAWAFKYNPYIIKEGEVHQELPLICDARDPKMVKHYIDCVQGYQMASQTDFILRSFGLNSPSLRHPRLYIYEDEPQEIGKLVVHTTGSDRTLAGEPAIRNWLGEDDVRVMSLDVMQQIRQNYKDWKVVQIGAKGDIEFPNADIDYRGKLDIWGSVKEIATATRYIGVVTGPMHIANCYPRVDKRIVLMEFSEQHLTTKSHDKMSFEARPGDLRNMMMSWLDPSNRYFNKSDRDMGFTFSYEKI